jgi:hypothetical protein
VHVVGHGLRLDDRRVPSGTYLADDLLGAVLDPESVGVDWIVAGVEEIVRYTYRLRPGAQAERALVAEWNRCRWLWNEAVHQQRSGRMPTRAKLGKLLTAAHARNTWLREGWQNAQANMLDTYAVALDRSFKVKGCGKPTVKKRHKALVSLALIRNGFAIRDGRLRLPGGVSIPVVWSRELPSDPSSVRVYRDSPGHRYASFGATRGRSAQVRATHGEEEYGLSPRSVSKISAPVRMRRWKRQGVKPDRKPKGPRTVRGPQARGKLKG